MKKVLVAAFIMACPALFAQLKLNESELKDLITIAKISHDDPNGRSKDFDAGLKKIKNTKFNHLIQVLSLTDGESEKLLSHEVLDLPSGEELQLWYALQALTHNMQEDNKTPRPDADVAKEALAAKVDHHILTDNYYQQLHGGIATLFNEKNLSKTNIDLNTYKLKDNTDKAILFLKLIHPMAQRFMVLNQMKNPDKLIEFAGKMPLINGKPYYYFTEFDFPDFEYDNYEGKTGYKKDNLQYYYNEIMCHFMAVAEKEDREKSQDIYFNSIMYKPEFFAFSTAEDMLKQVYENSKK